MPDEARPSRILIVDDHDDNLQVLGARLRARGFEIQTATSGQAALDLIAESPPDLILLDVMMPDLDGMEVARRIKANSALPFIPIIMQTALDTTDDKIEGLDAGADDYITKPINFAELDARVKSLLRIKTLQDDLNARGRELEAANEKLRHMSQTDALTGLDNRRHLEERMSEMYELSVRLHEPLACVMCDLDHFKRINDTHGHQAGDAILRQLATIFREQAREVDRIGRYGGEEFLYLLPGTVLDAAVTFAERVRHAVEAYEFVFEGGSVRGTMSAGVAAWPHPRVSGTDGLVKAADDALYVAKALGRNKVVRFDSAEFNAAGAEATATR